jgi:hypothetical protein
MIRMDLTLLEYSSTYSPEQEVYIDKVLHPTRKSTLPYIR